MKKYIFILTLVAFFLALVCFGCNTDPRMREIQSQNYKAYLDTVSKPQPVWKCTDCIIKGDIEIYQPGASNNTRAIQPPAEPENPVTSVVTRTLDRAVDIGLSTLPWYLAGKELGDVLITAIENAGHNKTTTGSFNTSDSFNVPTEYNYNNSFNGDYRDFSGDVDQSNHSINDSYNPVDSHDEINPSPSEYIVVTPVITGQ